jgi:hypothetical protein
MASADSSDFARKPTPRDQINHVVARARRDQDHRPSFRRIVRHQAPRKVEAALVSEGDVDENDVGSKPLRFRERLGSRRSDAGDRQALSLEQRASGHKKRRVVVDDQQANGHAITVPTAGSSRIMANRNASDAHERIPHREAGSIRKSSLSPRSSPPVTAAATGDGRSATRSVGPLQHKARPRRWLQGRAKLPPSRPLAGVEPGRSVYAPAPIASAACPRPPRAG